MTEFATLEIVTDVEVKGQEAQPNCKTLDPAQSHTPTPPPEGQSQTGTATAPANHSQPGSSQAKGMTAHLTITTLSLEKNVVFAFSDLPMFCIVKILSFSPCFCLVL